LHDEIGQALTAIKLNLREIRTLPGREAGEPQIVDSLEILGQVLQRVRSLALNLRPSLLDELGLGPALRWYVGRQAERAGWDVLISVEALTSRPSPEVEIACFRLTQEALTNVARHSQANKVEVRLERAAQELTLVIRDDGVGFDPGHSSRACQSRHQCWVVRDGGTRSTSRWNVHHYVRSCYRTEIRASFPLDAASECSREDGR
jgi:signal transduction histidine kinase